MCTLRPMGMDGGDRGGNWRSESERHDSEDCACSACRRARLEQTRQARQADARAYGGLSPFGLEVLGWGAR